MKNLKFYLNPTTGEVRVVRQISAKFFVVFKIINASTKTLKVWRGDLAATESSWKTVPYDPSFMEAMSLTKLAAEFFSDVASAFYEYKSGICNPFGIAYEEMLNVFHTWCQDVPVRRLYNLKYNEVAILVSAGKEKH